MAQKCEHISDREEASGAEGEQRRKLYSSSKETPKGGESLNSSSNSGLQVAAVYQLSARSSFYLLMAIRCTRVIIIIILLVVVVVGEKIVLTASAPALCRR